MPIGTVVAHSSTDVLVSKDNKQAEEETQKYKLLLEEARARFDRDVDDLQQKLREIEAEIEELKVEIKSQKERIKILEDKDREIQERIKILEDKDREREENEEKATLLMEFFDVALLFCYYKILPKAISQNIGNDWKQAQQYVEDKIVDEEDGIISSKTLNENLSPLNCSGVPIQDVINLTTGRSKEANTNVSAQKLYLEKIGGMLENLKEKDSKNPIYLQYFKSVENMISALKNVPLKRLKFTIKSTWPNKSNYSFHYTY